MTEILSQRAVNPKTNQPSKKSGSGFHTPSYITHTIQAKFWGVKNPPQRVKENAEL